MNKNLKKVWLDCRTWEEIPANMWGESLDSKTDLEIAIAFTGNHREYGKYMMRVIEEWPNSCLNSLTDPNINQKAWIGHAACAMAHNIPEDITRKAWGYLSNEQRALANQEAARAIRKWQQDYYGKSESIPHNLAQQVLL